MSWTILVAAVERGGSIKHFQQHELIGQKGNCMVNSARWLRRKRKGGPDFIDKYGTVRRDQPFAVPKDTRLALDKGYEGLEEGNPPYMGQVFLKFEHHKATDEYSTKTDKVREVIKPAPLAAFKDKLDRFVAGGNKALKGDREAVLLFRRDGDEQTLTFSEDWVDTLAKLKPGYYLVSLIGGTPHATAIFTTATEFQYFDPSIGELKLEPPRVAEWLKDERVTKYFKSDARTFMTMTRYIEMSGLAVT